jgi:hypothetical protein
MRSAVAAMAMVAVTACSDSLGPGEEPDLNGTWLLTAETIPASATFCTLEFTLEIVQTAAPPNDLIDFELSGAVQGGEVVCGDTLDLPNPVLMGVIVRREDGDGVWFGGPALIFGNQLNILTEGPIESRTRIAGRGAMDFTRGPHRPMRFVLTRQ